jgi:hypothetical protein
MSETTPMSHDYRAYLLAADDPRVAPFRGMSARAFAEERKKHPMGKPVLKRWEELYEEPFTGVTTDGSVIPALYGTPAPASDAAPVAEMMSAALRALEVLDPADRERVAYPVDAAEWRGWSNPEFVLHDIGVRLDEVPADAREALLGLVRATLSPFGYDAVTGLMALNAHLGRLTGLEPVMNENSYHVAIYGSPSATEPWGWQLFGHHVAVNVLVRGADLVVAPIFLGAEPNNVEGGVSEDLVFDSRQELALALLASFDDDQWAHVVLSDAMEGPGLPEGRVNPLDGRTLAGAFQDNAVIPAEGLSGADMSADQRRLLLELIDDHLALLPDGPRRARLRDVEAHLDDTRVCWIGGSERSTPFYFRVQGPTILVEFDHHSGVWLGNGFPATFHIHTTLRLPNGGDYGRALL